jgi:hypothetical protein
VDSNLGAPTPFPGIDPGDHLRNLDATGLLLTFRGDTYDLGAVVADLDDLLQRATSALRARRRIVP